MARTPKNVVTTYEEAAQYLGKKLERPLCNNTRIYRVNNWAIAIRYHNTDIITYYKSGEIVLDTGGYSTVTTKARMNWFTPAAISVYQHKWVWYVSSRLSSREDGRVREMGRRATIERDEY